MKIYLSAILLCLSICINAQNNYKKGYIITNNNDTVNGYINYRSNKANQEECMFKTDINSSDIQLFYPKDLKAYRIDTPSKYYIRKMVSENNKSNDGKEFFVEYLVSGSIDLFYYIDSKQNRTFFIFEENGKDPFYITQQSENVDNSISRTDTKYRGRLKYRFQDYTEIVKEIDRLKFDQRSMTKIVKIYDNINCTPTSEKCIIFENQSPDKLGLNFKFSVYTGIQQVGFTFKNIMTNGDKAITKGTSTYPTIGVLVFLRNPRFSESLGISAETSLSKIQDNTTSRYLTFDYKALCSSSKLGIRYTYPRFKFKPFLELGITYSALINSSCEMTILSNQDKIDYSLRSGIFGAYWGVGCEYKIYKEQSVFLRFNHDLYMKSNQMQANGEDKFNSWQLKLGYTF